MMMDGGMAEGLQPFQLIRLRNEAYALMERASQMDPAHRSTPEFGAATARSAARLARIWAWTVARCAGDAEGAARALNGAETGGLDRAAPRSGGRGVANRTGRATALICDIDALAERAVRLEALYRKPEAHH